MIPPILVIAYAAAFGYLLWNRAGRSGPRATPSRNEEAARRERNAKTGGHHQGPIRRETTKRDGEGNSLTDDYPTETARDDDLCGVDRGRETSAAKERIAIYTGDFYNRSAMNLARGLADRGFDVDFVVNQADGLYDEIPNPEQVFSLGHRYLRLNRWHRPRSWFEMAALVPRLLDYLRRRQPRILLASLRACNIVSILAARQFPELRVIVDPARHISGRYATGSRRERWDVLVERALYPRADMVVTETQPVADDLMCIAPEIQSRVRVVPLPIVRWEEIRREEVDRLEHLWMRDEATPVVLAASRFDPIKDHATLLRAFALVVRARCARLVIIGEGPERERIWTMARELGLGEKVALPGFQRNPFAWMARAQVFVVSSVYEGGPRVLAQAMACGTTPVSTDCPGGPRDMLGGGRWGELVPVGDHRALADAISRAIDHPIPPSELKRRADDYSVAASIDQYEELIHAVMDQPRSRAEAA